VEKGISAVSGGGGLIQQTQKREKKKGFRLSKKLWVFLSSEKGKRPEGILKARRKQKNRTDEKKA